MHLTSQGSMKIAQMIQMMCVADFAATYIYGKTDIKYEPDDDKVT